MEPENTIKQVLAAAEIGKHTELELRFGRKLSQVKTINDVEKRVDTFDANIGHRLFSHYLSVLDNSQQFVLGERVRSEIFNYDSGIRKEIFEDGEVITMATINSELSGNQNSIRNESN